MPFSEAWVATGMNMGRLTGPWGSVRMDARARVVYPGQGACISKRMQIPTKSSRRGASVESGKSYRAFSHELIGEGPMCRGTSRSRRHPPGSPHALSNESSWWFGAVAASESWEVDVSRAKAINIGLDS